VRRSSRPRRASSWGACRARLAWKRSFAGLGAALLDVHPAGEQFIEKGRGLGVVENFAPAGEGFAKLLGLREGDATFGKCLGCEARGTETVVLGQCRIELLIGNCFWRPDHACAGGLSCFFSSHPANNYFTDRKLLLTPESRLRRGVKGGSSETSKRSDSVGARPMVPGGSPGLLANQPKKCKTANSAKCNSVSFVSAIRTLPRTPRQAKMRKCETNQRGSYWANESLGPNGRSS